MMAIAPRTITHRIFGKSSWRMGFILESHHPCEGPSMNTAGIGRLRELAVNAYPTEFGGLVHVGTTPHRVPVEHDLAVIGELATQAGIEWLLFDAEAPILNELPLFGPQPPEA